MHIPYFLIHVLYKKESCTKRIRAVAEQRSSHELCLANKTKIHLKQKMNSKSLEYEAGLQKTDFLPVQTDF